MYNDKSDANLIYKIVIVLKPRAVARKVQEALKLELSVPHINLIVPNANVWVTEDEYNYDKWAV